MAKRFTATEIWSEDWFLIMPVEYKLFWYYMLANCNHAGFFRVNLRSFCGLNGVNLTSTQILDYFNDGKERIRIVNQSLWLIEDFFVYQYGSTLNKNNRVHDSITKEYLKHNIDLASIRGLKDLKDRVKDKDKDKDIDNNKTVGSIKEQAVEKKTFNTMPLPSDFNGLPEASITAIHEQLFIQRQIDLPRDKIIGMWEVFKVQNLTGKKYHPNEEEVYRYFGNWIKDKKFENGTNRQQIGVNRFNAGALDLLDNLKGKTNTSRS